MIVPSYFTRARFSASPGSLVLVDLSWLVRYSAIKVPEDVPEGRGPGGHSPSRSIRRGLVLIRNHAKKWVFWLTLSERKHLAVAARFVSRFEDFGNSRAAQGQRIDECRDGEGRQHSNAGFMLSAVISKS